MPKADEQASNRLQRYYKEKEETTTCHQKHNSKLNTGKQEDKSEKGLR